MALGSVFGGISAALQALSLLLGGAGAGTGTDWLSQAGRIAGGLGAAGQSVGTAISAFDEPDTAPSVQYSPAVQQATENMGSTELNPQDVSAKYQTFRRDRAAQGLAGLNPSAMLQQYAESLGIPVEQLLEILQQSGQGM